MFLCGQCHRHVRESVCPFCGAVQKGTPVAGASAVRIGMRRSAVLAAAAVAAIGSGVACGGSVETSPPPPQGDAAADVIAPVADYGIAVIPDSGPSHADAGTGSDAASAEGGAASDASTTPDAQTPDVFAPGADYGIPPIFDGGHP
jgi:hypothetical protein